MTSLSILNVKEFMNILLRSDTFDNFLLSEGSICTYMAFQLDGRRQADFFSPEDAAYAQALSEEYVPFSLARPACFALIRGNHAPSSFQFVLRLSRENQANTLARIGGPFSPEDITGMYLNLRYQNRRLTCTTGISCRVFSLDKSLEHAWDELVKRFLHSRRIPFEELA